MSNRTSTSEKAAYTSTRNACKLCSPLGASLVFRGIENCIPLIHGSQGCSTYIRRYIISHFREPVDIASSNFSEQSAVFGGGENLKTALDNIIAQYSPSVIGLATTCLSETIGDDVERYLHEYISSRKELNTHIVPVSTPSYSGTHMEGFRSALRAVTEHLTEDVEPSSEKRGINIVSSLISPEDIRYLKEIMDLMKIDCTILPDYSETLDGESWESYRKIPRGGTPVERIMRMHHAKGTIEFGSAIDPDKSVSRFLSSRYLVPCEQISLPIGIESTDAFFSALERLSGVQTHERYTHERGRLIDAYIDAHKYLFGARAILYGEIDFISALGMFLSEIGVQTVLCFTGEKIPQTSSTVLETLVSRGVIIAEDTDFETALETARGLSPDIIIGNSKGYYLAKRLGLPMVRCGFPVHDRFGSQRIMHIGYRGTLNTLDRIVNALIEARQNKNNIGYSYM